MALCAEGLMAVSGVPLLAVKNAAFEKLCDVDTRRTDRTSAAGRRHGLVLRVRFIFHRLPPPKLIKRCPTEVYAWDVIRS